MVNLHPTSNTNADCRLVNALLRVKLRKFDAEAGAHPCESRSPGDSIRAVIELGAAASCEQPGTTRNRHHGNRREKRHGTKTFGPKSIGIKTTASGGGSPQVPDRRCGGRGGERSGTVAQRRERRHLRNIAQCRARSAPIGLAALGCGRGGRDRNSERAGARHASRRLGFHGRRHQVTRYRVSAVQRGVELSRAARVADQLRRQQEARVPHLHPRGMCGGDGPRLFQGRRQADDDARPRHGRPAARLHGRLQCLVRPGAGHHRRRQ